METRFAHELTEGFFPKLLLSAYIVCVILTSLFTEQAVMQLSGDQLHLGIFLFYGLCTAAILTEKSVSQWLQSRTYRIMVRFLTGFMIYNFMAILVWESAALVFDMRVMTRANGTVSCLLVATAAVALGYLYAQRVRVRSYELYLGSPNLTMDAETETALESDRVLSSAAGSAPDEGPGYKTGFVTDTSPGFETGSAADAGFECAAGSVMDSGCAAAPYVHAHEQAQLKKCSCPVVDAAGTAQDRSYRIALISDLHLGFFVGEKHMRKVLDRVKEISPDLVLIAGDILDADGTFLDDPKTMLAVSKCFHEIELPDGICAVLGNHDPGVADERLTEFLSRSGIRLLHNEVLEFEAFHLIGRSDETNNIRKPLGLLMEKIDDNKPVIVVDHNPQGIEEAVQSGAALVLCGHTHAGQVFPATILARLLNDCHYCYGYESFGHTQTVITSGAGYSRLPMRIGSTNEVARLDCYLS